MSQDNFQKYGEKLKEFFGDQYVELAGNHILTLPSNDLEKNMRTLRDKFENVMLLDVCGVDNLMLKNKTADNQKRFESVYHLLNMDNHQRLRVKVSIDDDQKIPSVSTIWKTANWFERESWDMFGINYDGIDQIRLLSHQEFKGHELRKDYQEISETESFQDEELYWKMLLENGRLVDIARNFAGPFRIMAELEGEVIKRSKVETGHHHRGFEKKCEEIYYNNVIPLVERLNCNSGVINGIGWCKAVEELLDLEIPDRAKALRMVLAELARIMDHMICIGTVARELGIFTTFHFCFKQREMICDLFEKYCFSRMGYSATRIGGMAFDITSEWSFHCRDVILSIEKGIKVLDKMLTRSRIWMDRTKVCSISASDAVEWGYTGPCLRSCGVNYDIRKVSPYYYYNDVEFEIPLGVYGDCYDRYLVRMEEMRQSIKIITQILDNMPTGRILVDSEKICLPGKSQVYSGEKLKEHFSLIQNGIMVPPSEIYSSIEATNGELGFYLVSDGSARPYRAKVRAPSFSIYQSLPDVSKNHTSSDIIPIYGLMNIISMELER